LAVSLADRLIDIGSAKRHALTRAFHSYRLVALLDDLNLDVDQVIERLAFGSDRDALDRLSSISQ
jgi:hypothetical protein